MLDKSTKTRIDTARDILVGKIPDPKAQVEQITTALMYKFMDDMDKEAEELGGNAKFFANGYSQYSWRNLMSNKLSGEERLDLYVQAISNMATNEHIPPLFRRMFNDAFLPFRDPRTLNLFLKEINEFNYDNSENLGNAFEYLLSILGSQGDAGQFRTPRHIIDFIVEVIDPKKNEKILDPACGTAGFLISAYKQIVKKNSSNFKIEKPEERIVKGDSATEVVIEEKKLYNGDLLNYDDRMRLNENVLGYDISPDMVKLALVNLYLHGFPNPKVYEYDTLTSDKRWDDVYDVILANPPFMTPKGGIEPHKKFTVQAKRSEVLFVDYIAEHLTIKGRAGIIVPEGIIFQSANAYKNLRKKLIEDWGLYAVVSLPSGIFQPYSGVKTSILLIDRELSKKTKEILFLKVENDGYDLGAQRRKIEKDDLPECLKALDSWKKNLTVKENSKIAFAVEKEKIAENGEYNLTGDRYKKITDYSNAKWPMVKLEEIFIEIKNGKNVKQLDEIGKYKVSRIQTIANGSVNLLNTKYTNDEVLEQDFLIEGDILFSHINSFEHLAKTAIFKDKTEKVVHGINLIKLRPNLTKINSKFALAIFKTNRFVNYARNYAQKAVNQASINTKSIKEFEIPLPPLEIQEQIVAEIEQYQKVIDGAKQIVENWKPSFEIDPSWEIRDLGRVAKVQGGFAFKSSDMNKDGDVQVIKIGNVQDRFFDIQRNPSFLNNNFYDKYEIYKLFEGDILISMTGTAGKRDYGNVCLVDNKGKFLLNQRVGRIKPTQGILNDYLYILLNQDSVKDNFYASATGGIRQGNISNRQIESIKIPLPPLEIQKKIVAEIEEEQKIVEANKRLIEKVERKIEKKIKSVWGE